MEGVVNARCVPTEKWVVVEPLSSYSLPGGVMVTCCLLTIPTRAPYRLPVVLTNETQHDIAIPPRSVIAELTALQHVLPGVGETKTKDPSTDQPNPPPVPLPTFNFADSPIPAEWKDRIEQKTTSYARCVLTTRLRLW